MLDIRLLRHVLALKQYRNFARAAEFLRISQPALSRSIAGIEQSLGVKLFDRTPSGVEPTLYGQIVIDRGQGVIDQEEELRREILLMQGLEAGELSIGVAPFPFEISVCKAVAKLIARYPKLQLRISKDSPQAIIHRVLSGSIDLGIADIRHCHSDACLEIEPLPLHRIVCCCRKAHPLAGKPAPSLNEILGYPLVNPVFPPALAAILPAETTAGRVDAETGNFLPAITVDSIAAARIIAAGCDALLPIAPACVDAELQSGEFVILDFMAPWMHTQYAFISRKGRTHAPAALELMAQVREIERQAIERGNSLIATHANFSPPNP